jgi:hypothetical protein
LWFQGSGAKTQGSTLFTTTGEGQVKLTTKTIFAACALALSTGAFAAVTFDPETGTGFVGKGDVQSPFGWNNAKMQQRHDSITFTYGTVSSLKQACKDQHGNPHEVVGYRVKVASVGSVEATSRPRGQLVGWDLTGFGGASIDEDAGWTALNTAMEATDGNNPGNGCPVGSSPIGKIVRTDTEAADLVAHDYNEDKHTTLWQPQPQ